MINLPGNELVVWRVLAPNDGTPVRIPTLPPPYDRFHLEPTSLTSSASLEHIGHTRGYGALLEDIEGALYYRGQPGDRVVNTRGPALTR